MFGCDLCIRVECVGVFLGLKADFFPSMKMVPFLTPAKKPEHTKCHCTLKCRPVCVFFFSHTNESQFYFLFLFLRLTWHPFHSLILKCVVCRWHSDVSMCASHLVALLSDAMIICASSERWYIKNSWLCFTLLKYDFSWRHAIETLFSKDYFIYSHTVQSVFDWARLLARWFSRICSFVDDHLSKHLIEWKNVCRLSFAVPERSLNEKQKQKTVKKNLRDLKFISLYFCDCT